MRAELKVAIGTALMAFFYMGYAVVYSLAGN